MHDRLLILRAAARKVGISEQCASISLLQRIGQAAL
jgi:hypothetical protein